ncbi:MAG: hypothetical protein AAFR61_19645 [Bacteroidota bacterium]
MRNTLILLLTLLLTGAYSLQAQKTWTIPAEFNADQEITIYVNLKACDCQRLVGNAGPLYLWTWLPAPDADRADENKNGEWTNSNPTMAMKDEGNDVWSFTMIPTEFYNVDAATVFANDFHFLVKGVDGTGEGGGGCDEDKTEDLLIEVEPPVTGPRKVFSFPDKVSKDTVYTTANDVFTLFYDHKLEEKESMLDVDELYVYTRIELNTGEVIRVETIKNTDTNPALKMTKGADEVYFWHVIPTEIYQPPAGSFITGMILQIMKPGARSTSDIVDGEYTHVFSCY